MKSYLKVFWIMTLIFTLSVFACVTINIYFPAEKVKSVAGEIVHDIRGDTGIEKPAPSKDDNSSILNDVVLALFCQNAWAEEITTVSNPTIRALKEKMKERYALLKPYYGSGALTEGDDGYVSLGNAEGLGLKEKRDLTALIEAENGDRETLYEEVAKALNIDPSQINKVAEIFAQEWQKATQ
jgi:hypothetical protein